MRMVRRSLNIFRQHRRKPFFTSVLNRLLIIPIFEGFAFPADEPADAAGFLTALWKYAILVVVCTRPRAGLHGVQIKGGRKALAGFGAAGKEWLDEYAGNGGNGMLQGIEEIFTDRARMMKSLKKDSYEAFTKEFEREYGHYFTEMRKYTEQAEDGKAAAEEIGERLIQAMTESCRNKRGKLDGRTRSELSLFMVYYVFPAILKQGEPGRQIADGTLAACRRGLHNRGMKYVDYETIYNGFNDKVLGLF